MNATHRRSGEHVEQSPPTRAHGEASLVQVWLDGLEDAFGELHPGAFQVQDELGLGGRRGQQLDQVQSRAPRCSELPAIPQDRDRAGRLEMPDLEPASVEADVSFYKGRSEAFRGPESGQAVSGAVCDEKRGLPSRGARRRWPAHRGRV